jgi:hypothetical protein
VCAGPFAHVFNVAYVEPEPRLVRRTVGGLLGEGFTRPIE